jgi:hypothetical protein
MNTRLIRDLTRALHDANTTALQRAAIQRLLVDLARQGKQKKPKRPWASWSDCGAMWGPYCPG